MSKPFWELGVNPITMWKDESVERYLNQKKRGYYDTIDKRSKDYREYKEWFAHNYNLYFPKYTYNY